MTTSEIKLSPSEARLLQAFRNVTDSTRDMLVDLAVSLANDGITRRSVRPTLQLVTGGRAA